MKQERERNEIVIIRKKRDTDRKEWGRRRSENGALRWEILTNDRDEISVRNYLGKEGVNLKEP